MHLILLIVYAWLASVHATPHDASGMALCAASWEQADRDGDGMLVGREATSYLAMMYLRKATPPEDGRIDRTQFVEACLSGTFQTGFTQ